MKHFAHKHPLIFKELEEIRHCCNACGLYVLSSPCYMCTSTTQCCNFYLHQACANLPPESHHYFCDTDDYSYVEEHDLVLLAKPRDENCLCGKCGKLCENFIYHCTLCEFVLHPLCGFPLDIQIKHISHPQHPLVIVCREAPSLCDACGKKHEGYFFSCHKCNFWINHDCALLPSFVEVQNHEHYLSLIYSAASLLKFLFRTNKCLICSEKATIDFGFYHCLTCGVVTHVDCAISQMKDSGAIVHLPSVSIDTFPSSMIRTLAKEKAIEESNSTNMLENYNAHSLVLIDEEDIIAQETVCNACIQPISSPYYTCSAHSECNFLLHKFCVDLPLSIEHSILKSVTGSLVSPRLDEFFSLFKCYSCSKYCNGFGYSYGASIVDDLECSFSPRVIEHDSHKQHPLILTSSSYYIIRDWTSCCGKSERYVYQCGLCQFSIHIDCARITKTVAHKFDKHPLTLTFASSNSPYHNSTTDHFCEFCEEDIDSKYWFYHCTECDQSFHVDCIPSQGQLSKIKFGGTMEVPCHEDHPLRLTRMMDLGSQTCGFCHKIIEGFKDGMALHCQDCDFWIHFHCGYQSCDGKVSLPYRIPYV